jgi:hypothetical protein
MRVAPAINAAGLQRKEWLVVMEPPREVAEVQHVPAGTVYAEQWRPIAASRDLD